MTPNFKLTNQRLFAGKYEGVLSADQTPGALPELEMRGQDAGSREVEVAPIEKATDRWSVRAEIPAGALSEGLQTFTLHLLGEPEVLDSFTVLLGDTLDTDLVAEVDLLRAELDMLKMAFRRHCAETSGS